MTQVVSGGWNSYCNYGYEATYGAGAVSDRVFGHGTNITINRRNNMLKVGGLGSRNYSTVSAGKYEGSASVEFVFSNSSFWRAVLGSVADAGSGPSSWTHTYSEATALTSFAIDTGIELGTDDCVSELKGCVIASATLTAAVGELVKVRLECPYKTETLATAGIGSQVAESADPFTFAHGTVELPNGSAIGNVQSIELTINNNAELVWGLGSRLATTNVGKIREYNLRMSVAFDDTTDLLTKFLGDTSGPKTSTPSSQATIELTFTNSTDSCVITLADVYLDTENIPLSVENLIVEDVEGFALSGTSIVTTNSTEVDEGNP